MLRIYLIGELCVMSPKGLMRAGSLPGRQGRLAFAYLMSQRDSPVTRDLLVELLWPRHAPASFEVALSAVVSKVRALLAAVGLDRETLTAAARCYQVQLPAGSWVDIDAARQSVHDAEASLRSGSPTAAYGPAVVASAILRRPFLPGDDGTWIQEMRIDLLRLRLRALECLAEIHAWNSEPTLALRAAEEAVALEPYRETSYRRLIQIHESSGNRGEAMHVYERLRQLLASELGTRPASETQALVAKLAGGSD